MNIQRGTEQEIMQKLTAKWELIRQPVARLAIGLPSVHARELADEVVSGLHRTLNMVGWTLSEMAAQRPFTDALSRATKEWDQLNENVKESRETIHESS